MGERKGEKKAKIQPLLDVLLPLFRLYYVPHQAIAVEESVISFKGRVDFKQYLKGKPHPWGIKHLFWQTVLMGTCTIYWQRYPACMARLTTHSQSSLDADQWTAGEGL